MSLKTGLFFTLLLFTLRASRIKDPSRGKYRQLLESTEPDRQLPAYQGSTNHQVKRSTLFNTGVKVCPGENMAQVIASHIAYYKLRVCQEAVREAFQIFFDRVPDAMEYQKWINKCQNDSLCIGDLAQNFSSNQEHIDMVAKNIVTTSKIQNEPKSALATPMEGKKSLETSGEQEKSSAPTVRHVLEFSVKVKDTNYSELLRATGTPHYEDATLKLHRQMLQNFNNIPGFKEMRLLGIQPGGVSFHYAVDFETEADLTETGSLETSVETATEILLKDMILKILRKDKTLTLDIVFLSTDPNGTTEITTYKPDNVSPQDKEGSETISISEGHNTPKVAQVRKDVEVMENTTQISPPVTALVTHSLEPEATKGTKLEKSEKRSTTEAKEITEGYMRKTTFNYTVNEPEVQQNLENETAVSPGLLNLISSKVMASISNEHSVDLFAVTKISTTEQSTVRPFLTPSKRSKDEIGSDTVVSVDIRSEASEISSDIASAEGPSRGDPTQLLFPSVSSTVKSFQPLQSGLIYEPALLETIQRASPIASGNVFDEKKHQTKACGSNDCANKLPSETETPQSPVTYLNTIKPVIMTPNQANGLVVFFSLQVTNLMISEEVLNYSSLEYSSLANTFLELKQFSETRNSEASSDQTQREQRTLASIPLLMHLQSNMTGLNELYILGFKNGSMMVNSKMKLVKPVLQNFTKNIQCILKDFFNNASNNVDVEINAQSEDAVEGNDPCIFLAEHIDPCWSMDCNEFSHCVVNTLTTAAECVCDPGYRMVDGLHCQSICNLQPNYCLNEGVCENIPELGVTCRCAVGKYWYYQGARCDELVSLPADPFLFVACLVGSLTLACAVIGMLIFINNKCIRTRRTVTLSNSHSSFPLGGIMRANPVYENDESILTYVSSISYSKTTESGSSKSSELSTFKSGAKSSSDRRLQVTE